MVIQKQFSYLLKVAAVLLFLPLWLSGQNTGNHADALVLKQIADIAYFEDSSKTMVFSEVTDKNFISGAPEIYDAQSKYWYRFSIPKEADGKLLFLYFGIIDFSDVYIPVKGPEEYRLQTTGFLAKKDKEIIAEPQLYMLSLKTSDIDFSRPFYYNEITMTQWKKNNRKYLPKYFFDTDHTKIIHDMLQMRDERSDVLFYIGVVFIAFFLFLVNYFISKNKSFLIYGFYLFGVALYYANRLPLFINFYQNTVPGLYFYVNQLSHIANIGCYMWFVFYFLDFRHEFPKAYKFMRILLLSILIFSVLYGLQIILFPYFPYRFLAMDAFRLVTMVSSIGLFAFIMFQKPDTIAKIVLIGSLVLIVGNVLSLVLNDYTIFLKLMVLEIILFSIVVALKNKQIDDRRIKNRYAFEVEKMKTKNMEDLHATKTRFYENITHEFRTPLTLILSPIEQKLASPKLPPSERKELNLIQRNARRLLALVNQMLDLAKLETGNATFYISQGDLNAVLQPIINNFQKEALAKNIQFTTNIQDMKKVWFDRDIVEKITTNLMSNALKYTPENGSITIKSQTKKGYWVLVVTNTTTPGHNIDISKIFTRYYRADQQTEGTGIGLSITKELTELVNGNIIANILNNNDIQLTVALPIEPSFFRKETIGNMIHADTEASLSGLSEVVTTEQNMLLAGGTPLVASTYTRGKDLPKLLIVEDNPDMRAFIISIFSESHRILEAGNGKTGIKMAEKHLPDLIISDVMMPFKNGFELCDAIKKNTLTSHIPVILLTAKVGEENEIQGFKTGADAYITKPFSTEKLKIRAKQLIDTQKRLAEHYKKSFSIDPDLAITNTEEIFLKKLKTVLDEHITDANFDNETFGKLMQMSERQLNRKLKAIIGKTPTEFVRNERVKLAAKLLKKSDATVSEIAYQVGFNTPSYFIKCFRDVYGQTPSEYSAKI